MNAPARIPATIVTGFLGAGKTTLIRNLIANANGRRIAVIVNEFGDMGFDGALLADCGDAACAPDEVVELTNGCICCTVADDFQPAIEQILSRQPKVEHILIETSGLALPKPLVQAFQWPAIKSRVTVDAVVAVVDGAALAEGQVAHDMEALAAQRANDEALDHDDPVEEVFEDQVACADLIVLTKADLLDDAGLNKAKAHVLEHLPKAAKIVVASNGAIEPAVLIGLGLAVEEDIENRRTHHDGELDHEHDDFDSFVIDLPAVTDPDALAARIAETAAAENVLRIKGFIEVSAKPMRLQVQAVGSRVNHYYDRPWAAGEERRSRLVVIGEKGINREKIEQMLAA